MQAYKSTRYRCDFCRKSKTSKRSMGFHEPGCMLNPNRRCSFCMMNELDHSDPSHLDEVLYFTCDVMKVLRAAGGCPLCTLSAVMKANVGQDRDDLFYFDYKGELKKFDDARAKAAHESGETVF